MPKNPPSDPASGACPDASTGGDGGACASCPTDFRVDAPIRILKVNGGRTTMTAADLPEFSGGTFAWTTSSSKLRLTNASTATVTVEALATVSSGRDAETITVTRSGPGCSPVRKTVTVTVARVKFSASTNGRYGFDDFDTPADPSDDHVSIKKSDHTFVKVDLEGGALGTDFDFVGDDTSVCTPVAPGGTASFDLRIDAGSTNKGSTTLRARGKGTGAEVFASLDVRVYNEKVVEVVVAKIEDNTVAGTALRFGTADYGGHTATVNGKLKEAVVKFNITNYDAANAITNVRYDLDGNGTLTYDIGRGGGAELDAIKAAMTGTGTKVRIAVVRDMTSCYYLAAAAAIGDTSIRVTAGSVFQYPSGRTTPLGRGASLENVTVASVSGSTITLSAALTKAHAIGEPIEFPAGGWSSDPIIIIEGSASLSTIKWTIPHEVGHRALSLADVDDTTNFMNYMQNWTDYRLRYCPRNKRYGGGTETQWETIPR